MTTRDQGTLPKDLASSTDATRCGAVLCQSGGIAWCTSIVARMTGIRPVGVHLSDATKLVEPRPHQQYLNHSLTIVILPNGRTMSGVYTRLRASYSLSMSSQASASHHDNSAVPSHFRCTLAIKAPLTPICMIRMITDRPLAISVLNNGMIMLMMLIDYRHGE